MDIFTAALREEIQREVQERDPGYEEERVDRVLKLVARRVIEMVGIDALIDETK